MPTRLEINGSSLNRLVCAGQPVEIKVPVVSGATTYTYNLPTGFVVKRQLGSIIEVIPGTTAGTISVSTSNSCGTSPALAVPVAISVIPQLAGPLSGNTAPCSGTEVSYTVSPATGAVSYAWSVPAGWVIISGETTTNITVRAGTEAGNISVKAANICGGNSTQTMAVSPVSTPATPVISDNSNTCDGLQYAVLPVSNAATYNWLVPAGWSIEAGQGTTVIRVKAPEITAKGLISVVAVNGACTSPNAVYRADAGLGDGQLDFPNAFSPNNDQQNDKYVITNLQKYPDNDILVINRWGNQVFKQVNYQNNWDAKGLGDGTYFYVLRVKACENEQKIYRGYITIAR